MRRRVIKRISESEPDRSERMLQAAVDDLREALGARLVYGFSLARDGELHCVAVSPRRHAPQANIAPKDHPRSVSLLCKGEAGVLESWTEAEHPECPALFIPWWSEDGPVGAAVAVVDAVPGATALRLASAHGASVGSRLSAERHFATEFQRLGMLEQVSALLESAFESTTDAIVQIDLDGIVVRWNASAEQLYGWSAKDVLGKPVASLNDGWTRFARSAIRETASSGVASECEVVQIDRRGTRLPLRVTLLPMFDETGNAGSVVSIARTTGRNAVQTADVPSANRFANLMVREITGPLTAILGYSELLSRSAITEDTEQRGRVTRGLRDRCEDLARLLEDLMLLSRLDANALETEPVNLAELCRTLVSRAAAEKNGVRFQSLVVSGEGFARADRRSTEASVQGLLRCLGQHCSPAADVGFTISSNVTTAAIRVEVREPELGAAADLAERLEQLLDGENSGEDSLGLQVARLVAEAHGGALVVAPAAAPGPCFTLELPAYLPLGPAEEERWNSTMV